MTSPQKMTSPLTSSGKYRYDYPKADHTVDAVVFGLDLEDEVLNVLLVERGVEPFAGHWALPGGFVLENENLDEAVERELREETGVKLSYMEQLYTFGRTDRDPRGRVISTAYLGCVRPSQVSLVGGSDASNAAWHSARSLPALAFDHAEIVETALRRLRSKAPWQPVSIDLLPPTFTLSDLQRVYEIILDGAIDKRNFRRKILSFDALVDTGTSTQEGAHRPAKLYRFDRKRYQQLQKQGVDFQI